MYSNIFNHIFNFSHFFLAFIIVFIICPRFLFIVRKLTLESIISNFVKMIFWVIIWGYLLVFLKLFEFLSLAIIFLLGTYYTFNNGKSKALTREKKLKIRVNIFNYSDGIKSLRKDLLYNFKKRGTKIKNGFKETNDKIVFRIDIILLSCIILYSAYLRFFNAFHFAAPSMSDGSVTLAWMKYIIQRVLFHDGVYPHGFHIYLATLQKIALVDSLYILNYAGPYNGVLVTFGIYFFMSRTVKEKAPAFVAALTYGVLGYYLPIDWMRQAATNAQEFGYVFIFPSLYFSYMYFLYREKKDLVNVFIGASVTGLVHPIAYAFNVLGIALMGALASILDFRKNFNAVWKVFLAGVLSVIVTLTPIVAGLLFKKDFHSASAEFLTANINIVACPQLKAIDYLSFCGLAILFINLIIHFKNIKSYFIELYALFFCSIAFLIYYFGGVVTQNAVITTRFSDLWAFACPVAMGFGFSVTLKLIKSISIRWTVGVIICSIMLLTSLLYIKPQPIITYKMDRNEEVEQYLRITSICNPTQWAIVCDTEGAYSLILGRGTHIRTNDFLKKYSANVRYIYYEGSEYKIPDVFIYYDKVPFSFEWSENLPQRLINDKKRRDEANKDLKEWLDEYKKTHNNIEVFYEDESFMIYHIQQELTRDETLKKIFNY